jgi:hypothetical protein
MNYTLYYQGIPRFIGDIGYLNSIIERAVKSGAVREQFEMKHAAPGDPLPTLELPADTHSRPISR